MPKIEGPQRTCSPRPAEFSGKEYIIEKGYGQRKKPIKKYKKRKNE